MFKTFQLGDLPITIYKRRRSRHLRLSVSAENEVQVSIPLWATYRSGLDFAASREAWIRSSLQPVATLSPGQSVGMTHRLQFRAQAGLSKPTSRVGKVEIIINHPPVLDWQDASVQAVAEAAAVRALRKQAASLLPHRLQGLAAEQGLTYSSVHVKQLKARWGSCDQNRRITLNIFLLQLPWELIDYVLLHELTHTQHLNHSPEFWAMLNRLCPDAQARRRQLRNHKPVVKRPKPL